VQRRPAGTEEVCVEFERLARYETTSAVKPSRVFAELATAAGKM
jgi:hypothetical protein